MGIAAPFCIENDGSFWESWPPLVAGPLVGLGEHEKLGARVARVDVPSGMVLRASPNCRAASRMLIPST